MVSLNDVRGVGVLDDFLFLPLGAGIEKGLNDNNGLNYQTESSLYEYDAWGNLVNVTDITSGNWSKLNLLRYRGYYYDEDTGLYYLGSRYYDPEVGRLLNSDSILSTSAVLGFNNYAYCLNNPTNMSDPSGNLPFFVVTAAVGAIAGGIIGGIKASKNGKNVWAGIGIGAVAGGLLGAGAGMFAAAALAGNAAATTTMVLQGGAALVSTISAGGLSAGAAYIADNLNQAVSNVTTTTAPISKGFDSFYKFSNEQNERIKSKE